MSREKRPYLVGRFRNPYPNSNVGIFCIRDDGKRGTRETNSLDSVPPGAMEIVEIRAHNKPEAKGTFMLMLRLEEVLARTE